MRADELFDELDLIVENKILDPVLILGKSGTGKTSVIDQVLWKHGIEPYQVRWGELAPVDARGVPVANHELKLTEFYPPSFWPREGSGPAAIVLDEYNMASTAMMGLGQRLLLDRRFGDYRVPDGVLIWAAGNRKEDLAAVNEIPAPTNNRLAHYVLEPSVDAWKPWAYRSDIDPKIIGFLEFQPDLLHKFDKNARAWPSPRSWEMANRRFKVKMSVAPVVGEEVSDQLEAYSHLVDTLPKIEDIANGLGSRIQFPEEPSMKYAVVSGLKYHAMQDWAKYRNSFIWLTSKALEEPDWVQSFVSDVMRIMGRNDPKRHREYIKALDSMPEAKGFLDYFIASRKEEKWMATA